MRKSKQQASLIETEELVQHFRNIPTEQLQSMKFSPRGNIDRNFKRALNQELKSRGINKK